VAQALFTCKVTVLKVTINQDLVDQYLDAGDNYGPCDRFQVGQTFVVDQSFDIPADFCPWAWADIRKEILNVATGASKPWIKQPGTEIAGCTDWFRPVYFKIERVDEG
jgi:uncharacterized repeat protein (TIGR04076 family)